MTESAERAEAQGRRLPSFSSAVVLLCAALVLYPRAQGVVLNPDPWVDEAMQLLNFLRGSWSGLFRPQPYFEQATSLGYLATGILAADLIPEQLVRTLRLISALASLGAALLLFLALRSIRPTLEAALIATVAALTPTAIYQGVEIKAYAVEALCTAALLATALHAYRNECSRTALALFLAVAVASLIFANSALFPIAGFSAALFLSASLEPPRDPRRIIAIVAVGALIMAVAAALYVGYTAPSTAIQLQAYAGVRAMGQISIPLLEADGIASWARLLNLIQRPFLIRAAPLLYVALHLLALAGLATSLFSRSRVERFIALGCALSFVALAIAAAAGLFTPYRDRHVLFSTPLTAFFLMTGLQGVIAVLARGAPAAMRSRLTTAAMATLVLAYGANNLRRADHVRAPMRPATDRLAAVPAWPEKTWVYYAAQPAFDLQTWPRHEPYLGRVPQTSSTSGWALSVRRRYELYVARFTAEVKGRDELYILTSHVLNHDTAPLLAIARNSIGPCRVISTGQGVKTETALYHCQRPRGPRTPAPMVDSASHLAPASG